MKNSKTFAIALVAIAAATGIALAQGPMPGGGGRPLNGKVSAVDTAANTLTVTTPFDTEGQTVTVTKSTKILTAVATSVSSLSVGDQIQVMGTPTAITAVSVTSGELPTPPAPPTRNTGAASDTGNGPGNAGPPPQMARVGGKVTSVSPLKIMTLEGSSITIGTNASTKVNKIVDGDLSSLKTGQTVSVFGRPGDAAMTANRILVGDASLFGPPPGGMRGGQGGFGGRGRQGRRGGGDRPNGQDGGPGGDQGGPGGGPGGPDNMGGPGGDQGGPGGPGFGPPPPDDTQ